MKLNKVVLCWVDGGNKKRTLYGSFVVGEGNKPQRFSVQNPEFYPVTNNVAEYIALGRLLLFLLRKNKPYQHYIIRMDSKLVLNQVGGSWRVKKEHLKSLTETVRLLLKYLDSKLYCKVTMEYVPRKIIFSILGH